MRRSLIRTLYYSTRTLGTVVKDASRARRIATILARYGFAQLLSRRGVGSADARRSILDGDATDARRDVADRLVSMLEELGPTFVKFGQILSTRPDLIPGRLSGRLQQLQDKVAPVPYADVAKSISESFGLPPEELFASFDQTPIAAASMAQVHGAVTKDGHDVVVKVQRRGIRPTIEADLSLLRFFAAQVLDIFPEATLFDLAGMVAEFEKSLMRELDFEIEKTNLERFRANFADKPKIHVPAVFPQLSSKTVLTMERVRGRKLTAVVEPETRASVAALYLDAAYRMVFKDGFFHGDLHPGNVFLEDDGRLGLIDFGMVGRLSRQNREKVVDVIFAVLNEDLEGVARIWYSVGRPTGRVDYAAFEAEVVDVLERHVVGRPMEEWDLGSFFRDLAIAAVRHGIRLPSDFTMMFKAMVTTEGLARQVAQGINPIEAARPYIESLIKERYSLDRVKKMAVVEGIRVTDLLRELPGAVERLLSRLEQGDLAVRMRHEELEPQVKSLVRGLNRAAVALVVAAASITGALTMRAGPPVALGAGAVSVVSFGIALLGIVWLGVGILRGR